jgi:hypothetical protein
VLRRFPLFFYVSLCIDTESNPGNIEFKFSFTAVTRKFAGHINMLYSSLLSTSLFNYTGNLLGILLSCHLSERSKSQQPVSSVFLIEHITHHSVYHSTEPSRDEMEPGPFTNVGPRPTQKKIYKYRNMFNKYLKKSLFLSDKYR